MKKKLMLKKEAICILKKSSMSELNGGDEFDTTLMLSALINGAICGPRTLEPFCQTQAGGGARAAGSCNNCEQNTVGGKDTCFPYDCAPTDGGNSCNFPDGCHLPSVGCAQ